MLRRTLPAAALAVLLLLPAADPARAADIVVPPAEAPTEIFSASLGDEEVELSLLGSWTAGISFGTGVLFAPGLPVQQLDGFPGIDLGFRFSQTPDVTLSLRMLRRYFLELSVLGSFEDNSILLGYDGDPGETLQSVRVGTEGIEAEPSAFLQIPRQASGSLGASARFAAGAAANEVLVRWDSSAIRSKAFLGKNELAEEDHQPGSYVRGRYFFLPDVGVQDLQVFLEDPSGTILDGAGRKYRLAGFDDVIADSANGLVSLKKPASGRVVVFYRRGLSPVGAAGLGIDGLPGEAPVGVRRDLERPEVTFQWGIGLVYLGEPVDPRRIAVAGTGDCLLLWEPGDSSPFEVCNTYSFSGTPPSDASRIAFAIVESSPGSSPSTPFVYLADPPGTKFSVLHDRDPAGSKRFANFYPFPDPEGLLYGPARDSVEGLLGYEIGVQFLTPVESYVLESDIVAGSVQVTLNGTVETRFEVDAGSGILKLLFEVLPTDRIEVRWRKAAGELTGGDLLLAWRDRIPLGDAVSLELSAGLRWNVDPASYSTEPYASSGTLIAAAGLRGESGPLTWSVEAGAAVTNPDTTGILRLFGMEGRSFGLDLSEEMAYPAAPPSGSGTRGKLQYRDYRSYGALGSASLQPIDWAGAPAALPYADGQRMGPYNVAGSSAGAGGRSLVLDFDLGVNEWVGAQLPVAGGGDVDLSEARSVTIRFKTQDVVAVGALQLQLQLGSLGEDLDGDSLLDAEPSSTVAGFSFDPSGGPLLKVGAGPRLEGNGILDTEDRNANGILDTTEDPLHLVTIGPAELQFSGDEAWQTFTYALTSSERGKLQAARGVRLLIIGNASASRGRAVIDSVSIERSPFWAGNITGGPTGAVTAREAPERLLASDPGPGNRLEDRFPEAVDRFHDGSQAQEVLELSWNGVDPDGALLTGYAQQGTGGIAYDEIVLYMRASGLNPAGSLAFSLLDAEEAGITWKVDATEIPDAEWHELRVSRTVPSVSLDGTALSNAPSWNAAAGDLRKLSIKATLSDAGAVWLDEVHLVRPRAAVGVALLGDLSARFPGPLLKVGGLTILSDVFLQERLSIATAGFSTLYGIPLSSEDLSSRTGMSANVLRAALRAEILLREHAGLFDASGSHGVTVPAAGGPVVFADSFSLSPEGSFARENSLDLKPLPAVSARFSSRSDSLADRLSQSWSGTVGISPLSWLTVRSQAEVTQSLAGWSDPEGWYGARWLQGWTLLAPWQGGGDEARAGTVGAQISLTPGEGDSRPLEAALGLTGRAGGSAYSSLGRTQANEAGLSASLLYRFMRGEVTTASLGVRYARSLSLTTLEDPGARFHAEAASWASAITAQGYLLSGIPLAEIFADGSAGILDLWPSPLVRGSYSPSAAVTFQRSHGSRPLDLLVPSLVEIAAGREVGKEGDLSKSSLWVRPKLATRAVNLFGRLGSTPLLAGMRTDEYSASLEASIEQGAGEDPVLARVSLEAYAALYGCQGEELTLVETLQSEQSVQSALLSQTQLVFDWSVRPAAGVPFRFLPEEMGKSGFFEHRESAQLTVSWQEQGAWHPASLLLTHATSLRYPERGFLKASASVGFDLERLGEGVFAGRIALRAGLEANLTF